MIDGKRIVAVIPARAGSKAVKHKNVRVLGGRPLIRWTIDLAREMAEIDRVIVSTDGARIAEVARAGGAEVYDRPPALATDTSLVADTLRDLIHRLRVEGETAEYMILLEPTSPFRAADDVRACIEQLARQPFDSVATFTEAALRPDKAWRLDGPTPRPFIAGADPWRPRQRTAEAYQLSGAAYAFSIDLLPSSGAAVLFGRCGAVVMPRERCLDIDDTHDFALAEDILSRNHASSFLPDGIVYGDELGSVGEGSLDLDLVNHLGYALHDIVPAEDRRAELHELSDGAPVTRPFENLGRDEAYRFGIVELDAPIFALSGELRRDKHEKLLLLSGS